MTSADRVVTLFLHTPKCAGTTLADLIYPNYADPTVEVAEDGLFHRGLYYFPGDGFFKPADLGFDDEIARVMQRPDLNAVIGHFWYGLHRLIPRECKYVTLLRDPAQRLWSLYNHLEYGRWSIGFDEFLHTGPWRELDNDQTRRVAGIELVHWRVRRSSVRCGGGSPSTLRGRGDGRAVRPLRCRDGP